MLDDPLEFTGSETLSASAISSGEIVIGIFAPDDENHPVGRALVRGATLAVDQANATGGSDGRPIRLVRRWADDPWGAGSKEVIRLVFEDRAWALIGGPDGASTHVAQQIATKAHIPLIAPVSSDPSLTHTRVPWIFRLPPDDTAQAALLVGEGIAPMKLERIGLLSSTDHDGRTAAAELVATLERAGSPPVFHLEVAPNDIDPADLVARIVAFEPDGLIIRIPRTDLRRVAEDLGAAGLEVPIFLPWIPGLDLRQSPLATPGPVVSVAPFAAPKTCGPYLKLVRAFIERHGEAPTPAAVYGYDAAQILIEAFRSGASGRVELVDRMTKGTPFTGATGTIAWDTGGGNRSATAVLATE